MADVQYFQQGQVVIKHDSVIQDLILVSKGQVVYNSKNYYHNECIFEKTLIRPSVIKVNAICLENSEIVTVTRENLYNTYGTFPKLYSDVKGARPLQNYKDPGFNSEPLPPTAYMDEYNHIIKPLLI